MVKKKELWEDKKELTSASISLKKTIGLSISKELLYILEKRKESVTELYMEFLLKESRLDRRTFDERIIGFIKELCNIKGRSNSRKFRKFLAEHVETNSDNEQLKKRMREYVKEEHYI